MRRSEGPGLRIVFFGATDFGHRCCRALLDSGEDVVGIVTSPREFRISYAKQPVRNVTYRSFDDLAQERGIPVIEVESSSDARLRVALEEWRPDFGLAIGWFYIVPREIREQFARGVAGIHSSLLPRYRGGAPLVWAIINGETETGVTLFHLDDGVDTGDIIGRRRLRIRPEDTIRELYERATRASVSLLQDFVPQIRQGTAPRIPQDHAQATEFPQRSPADGLIDWTRSPEEIRNFIRAQTHPYPGAFTIIEGKRVTIWEADIVDA